MFIIRDVVSKIGECEFVGIDLNEDFIKKEIKRNNNKDISFRICSSNNTLYVCCGTLEYYTQNKQESWLTCLSNKMNADIVLCEPIDLDRSKEFNSTPWGTAFLHNYECLLERNGFNISRKEIYSRNPRTDCYGTLHIDGGQHKTITQV